MRIDFNGKVFSAISSFADFVVLNLLCVVCCIPIITIGPAICALYYCMLKVVRKQDFKPVQAFFHSFKDNFKQGCTMQLLALAVTLLLYLAFNFALNTLGTGGIATFILSALFIIALVCLLVVTLLYPTQAQFSNPIPVTLRNALLFAISNLPYALTMVFINIIPILLYVFATNLFWLAVPYYIFIGFSVATYINSRFLKDIFKPYMPQ